MTMTAFTGMLKFQPLAETVMVIVKNHSPVVSSFLCKLIIPFHLRPFMNNKTTLRHKQLTGYKQSYEQRYEQLLLKTNQILNVEKCQEMGESVYLCS